MSDWRLPPRAGDLRVWWIPQVPGKEFYVYVGNVAEARRVLDALAEYDKFQFENRIKPDYANTGGLHEFHPECVDKEEAHRFGVMSDGWVDWYDEESGMDFDDWCSEFPEKVL